MTVMVSQKYGYEKLLIWKGKTLLFYSWTTKQATNQTNLLQQLYNRYNGCEKLHKFELLVKMKLIIVTTEG
jgi:hypothetical protein